MEVELGEKFYFELLQLLEEDLFDYFNSNS
jgi:hypothetical protein